MAKILLIDDQQNLITLTERALQSLLPGLEITGLRATHENLGNPELLLQLIHHIIEQQYDLVITDNDFKTGIYGTEVAQLLKEQNIPVLISSGNANETEFKGTVLGIGLDLTLNVLSKPFEPMTLVRKVKALLSTSSVTTPPNPDSLKFLLIDDDEVILEVTKTLVLSKTGPLAARNPEIATVHVTKDIITLTEIDGTVTTLTHEQLVAELVRRAPEFSMVITDNTMPGVTGVTIAGELKSKTTILILSGDINESEFRRDVAEIDLTEDQILGKPVKKDVLHDRIQLLLERVKVNHEEGALPTDSGDKIATMRSLAEPQPSGISRNIGTGPNATHLQRLPQAPR
ncbi:hypothetical protein HY570_01775 [Candidatus Micrarchaeota archaeon]|nr:hypothetical protein [Candidatus Micrarchaeota archaeon]